MQRAEARDAVDGVFTAAVPHVALIIGLSFARPKGKVAPGKIIQREFDVPVKTLTPSNGTARAVTPRKRVVNKPRWRGSARKNEFMLYGDFGSGSKFASLRICRRDNRVSKWLRVLSSNTARKMMAAVING